MSLHHQLKRLERHLPKPEPQCAGCGYPKKARLLYVITRDDNPLPTCSVCHRPLDEDGIPIDSNCKWIVLDRGDVV